MVEFTSNYSLTKPDFDISPWHDDINTNFDILDTIIFAFTGIGNIKGEWKNNTSYIQGDRVIDGTDGSLWQCLVSHTSATAPTTFSADRTANPTYWQTISQSFGAAQAWTTATSYAINDFLYDGHRYGVALANFVSGASYNADVSAGNIATLADLTTSVTNAATSASNAATSASAASGSASSASTSATNAGNSASSASTSATNASNSASAASTSATNAGNSASAASTSATNAGTSETNAAASASAAASSAAAAASYIQSFRNKIINGNFDIWQRSTSVSSSVVTYTFAADRWRFFSRAGGVGSGSLARQAFTVGQTDVPGNPTYFARWSQSAAPSGSVSLSQPIEDVRTLSGQTVTVTLWAKASASKILTINLQQNFGSGGSSAVNNIAGSSLSVTTSWQKFTRVISVASISGKTLGSNHYLDLVISNGESATFQIDIARVSVVLGNASSETDPFENRHIAQELILCQRYYFKGLPSDALNYPAYASGATMTWTIAAPVTMRVVPTIAYDVSGSTLTNIGTFLFNSATVNGCRALAQASAMTTNAQISFGASDYCALDAEF